MVNGIESCVNHICRNDNRAHVIYLSTTSGNPFCNINLTSYAPTFNNSTHCTGKISTDELSFSLCVGELSNLEDPLEMGGFQSVLLYVFFSFRHGGRFFDRKD